MEIKTVGVVGCGLMGAGIAQTVAEGGFPTVVREPTPELLNKGLDRIRNFLAKGVEKGKTTTARRDEVWGRVCGTTELADLAACDLVIEAIVEDRAAKENLFAELDRICQPGAILATNTSSYRVTDLANATQRPTRVVGLHYFFPSAINKLLEVIRTSDTPPETVEALVGFARRTGKLPIRVQDAPGFAVNRYFVPWLNESVRLLDEEVANIPTIEAAAVETFGVGMGPFALMNATGIPISYHSTVALAGALGPFYAPATGLTRQFESGQPWDLGGQADTSRQQLVAERLLGVVCGIATQLAEEGVATVEDIERGATTGLRWPQGPFALMNTLGSKRALQLANQIEDRYPGFTPKLLKTQAATGKPWTLRDVRLSIEGPVAYITMSRPEALNALNSKVLRELEEALATVRTNADARVVILSGEGGAFVAGADIKEMQALAAEPAAIRAFTTFGQGVLSDLESLPQPVIAVIDGFALGGGLELALACDIRLASPESRFGYPEVGLGIIPGLGGTQRTPRLVGSGFASELILTGDIINANEAARIGLVNRVLPSALLMEAAKKLAGRIASRAPLAIAKGKAAIQATQQLPLAKGLGFELEQVTQLMATPDRVEGMQAFIEKRKPVFTGESAKKPRAASRKTRRTKSKR